MASGLLFPHGLPVTLARAHHRQAGLCLGLLLDRYGPQMAFMSITQPALCVYGGEQQATVRKQTVVSPHRNKP